MVQGNKGEAVVQLPKEFIRFTGEQELPADFFPLQLELKPSGVLLEFLATRVVIGRGSDADFRLPSSCISRQHCRLQWDREGWWLADLQSENGTWVNGKRVPSQALRIQDEIQIGDFRFSVLKAQAEQGLDTLLRQFRKAG
jgi:predicted component of type VI protein secretion system